MANALFSCCGREYTIVRLRLKGVNGISVHLLDENAKIYGESETVMFMRVYWGGECSFPTESD